MKTLLCITAALLVGCASTPVAQSSAGQGPGASKDAAQPCHVQSKSRSAMAYCFNEDAYLRSMSMR